MRGFNLLYPARLIVPALILSAVMIWSTLRGDPRITRSNLIGLLISFCSCGAGGAAVVNVAFDAAPAQVFRVPVVERSAEVSKRSWCRVTLAPWGPQTAQETVGFPLTSCDTARPGETIKVSLHQGLFHIP